MSNWELAVLVALSLVAVASGLDIYSDLSTGASIGHLFSELGIVFIALSLVGWLGVRLRAQIHATERLKADLAQARAESDRTTPDVLAARQQLSTFIRQQFEKWTLTGSEQEVALLLIKGLSLKEIGLLRNTAEKTVRQQASAIYRKANLSGRHALAAWFIEDFLQIAPDEAHVAKVGPIGEA